MLVILCSVAATNHGNLNRSSVMLERESGFLFLRQDAKSAGAKILQVGGKVTLIHADHCGNVFQGGEFLALCGCDVVTVHLCCAQAWIPRLLASGVSGHATVTKNAPALESFVFRLKQVLKSGDDRVNVGNNLTNLCNLRSFLSLSNEFTNLAGACLDVGVNFVLEYLCLSFEFGDLGTLVVVLLIFLDLGQLRVGACQGVAVLDGFRS